MSNFIYDVSYEKTGFSYNKYNSDIKLKGTFNDFVLPAWSVENFNQNEAWKARYLLTYKETYEDLTEEQKEKLRQEVFESWGQTIWSIIRQRFGLVLDVLGWNYLTSNVKQNLHLAIAYQINNWRVNLPYEINNNINRVSGNLQTTINASAFETGFDALGEQTKMALTATGLDTYNYEDLLTKCYREDTLAIEVEDTKDRISALEARTDFEVPDNLITRTEAANLFEKIGGGYITQAQADNLYVKSVNLNSLTNGGYFENENKVSDAKTVKSLKETSGSKELRINTSTSGISFQFLNNNNIERAFDFSRTGFTVDNQDIPTTTSILSSVRNNYYDKIETDTKINEINSHLTSEDNKVKDDIRSETANNYYNKQDTDLKFYDKTDIIDLYFSKAYINNNYYTKSEVDTKIVAAQTSGQVDLSNYYNKNEADTLFENYYKKEETDNKFNNYYDKSTSDLRLTRFTQNFLLKTSTLVHEIESNTAAPLFIIRGNPVINSNNAARMEDVVSEVKRLFIAAITEYDKTGKKEFTNIVKDEEFYTLESDDEEIIITIENQQKTIDATSITFSGILIFENTFYQRQTDGTDEKIDQKILLKKNGEGKLQFSFTRTETNIGNAGIGTIGTFIVVIDKVEIRKDSVRELVNSLQKIS